jgi:hypothetical protein
MGKNITNHRRSLRSAKVPKVIGQAKTLARPTSTEKFLSTVMKQKSQNLAETWANEGGKKWKKSENQKSKKR